MSASLTVLAPIEARADICVSDSWDNGAIDPGNVFPNWTRVWAGSFDVQLCLAIDCDWDTVEQITGMTVVNFGTAAAGITGVAKIYVQLHCNAADSGLLTLTYAGTYTEDSGSYPAWTWAGTSPDFALCADQCGVPACGGYFVADVYADIGSCPVPQSTVMLGFPYHEAIDPLYPGSMNDSTDCVVPWFDMQGPPQTIQYVLKEGLDAAAPGDTVDYTIYYGRPGTASLNPIQVTDSMPAYTHYFGGSAVPALDPGWDPLPGSPSKLRWTIPGPLPVTGGPTGMVTFQLTVDWGNGDKFEPGSGDDAAPEGTRLRNTATVSYYGITGCGYNSVVSPQVTTMVHRYLFWKLGDNDVLFASSYGQPPDQMTYSIFFKNLSDTETWWDVHIWDSVPAQINTWCANCGIEDPCVGWTMTPSGCASASPGVVVNGATTLLTWKMDMPPGVTLTLRWLGQVKPSAVSGSTVINRANIKEYGRTGVVGGTGNSGVITGFSHLAPVILPTTYVSYVGMAGAILDPGIKGECPGFFLAFFPMNTKSQFELRGLQYQGAGWSTVGGISDSIGSLVGDCINGFPGGALPGGGVAGCRAERIPARYEPTAWVGACPTYPFNFIYKITSNSPVLWQLLTYFLNDGDDNQTFAPSTTLTYAGLMHYAYKRTSLTQGVGYGDALGLVNTGMDAYGNLVPGQATTVYMFRFNYGTLSWDFMRYYDIDAESQAFDIGTPTADLGPWRTVSSDMALLVNHGFNIGDKLACCCGTGANDNGAFMPTRETGNTVTKVGSGTSYGYIQGTTVPGMVPGRFDTILVVGNTGTADATYEIWRYRPDDLFAMIPMSSYLNGTSGSWDELVIDTVPAGLNNPGNPRIYRVDGNYFGVSSLGLYRIKLTSGGPIQSLGGVGVYALHSGGAVIQAANGDQTGQDFWLHMVGTPTTGQDCGGGPGGTSVQTVNVFCPKQGMVVRGISESGYSATYTTTGPDQCVSFTALTDLANAVKCNYRFQVLSTGQAMTQFIECDFTQKGYTAPFLQTGTHYQIIVPPVVFVGQTFWITIIVLDSSSSTKCDYAGTTSFTSTDPAGQIEGKTMDSYNYTWKGATDCGVKIFFKVTFTKMGMQTIVAVDTLDGSITGVAALMVVAADIKLEKLKKVTVAASGDTVKFQICWSNYSSASGFSFTITDAVPMGTTYVPEIASTMLCQASTPLPSFIVWYSTAVTTTPPATFTSVPGTSSPLSNTRWLRWTIRDVYVNSTGCVCFKVSVN